MIVLESRIQNSRPNDPMSGPTNICEASMESYVSGYFLTWIPVAGEPSLKGASMESYVSGYFLTIDDLQRIVRDFQADCHDGFVSNDKSYIEAWLKKHEQIVNDVSKSMVKNENLKPPKPEDFKNMNEYFKASNEYINKTTLKPPEGFNYFDND
jgi:hypothetical protein